MITGGHRMSGTLHYALTRERWRQAFEVGDEDRSHLRGLAIARVPEDLRAIELGREVAHLQEGRPLFVP